MILISRGFEGFCLNIFYPHLKACLLNNIKKTAEMLKIVKIILKKYKYHISIWSRKKPCKKCVFNSFRMLSENKENVVQSHKPMGKQEIFNKKKHLKRGQSKLNFKFWMILCAIPISPVHCKPVNQNSHEDTNSFSFDSLTWTQQIILIIVIILLPILVLLVFRIIILGKYAIFIIIHKCQAAVTL